jgi:hypothetical protein
MRSRYRSLPATLRLLALALGFFLTSPLAFAQSKSHLDAGAQASQRGDWSAALTEYSIANRIETSGRALEGMANAHYQLNNLVEAYDAYDALNRSFPRAITKPIRARMEELRLKTGLVSLSVREPDAAVTMDGRNVGISPITSVLRVNVGHHTVRAAKEGYVSVAQGVDVADVVMRVDIKAMTKAAPLVGAGATALVGAGGATTPVDAAATAPASSDAHPSSAGGAVWDVPHGSRSYAPLRVTTPPKIDGILDDEIWKKAVRDSRFVSTRSKPYGQATVEPTIVQVGYDDEYLYVAFRCGYSGPRPRDNSVPSDEVTLATQSEAVAVLIDPLHDHANARNFLLGRTGARGAIEFTDGGNTPNPEWRGIWDSATQYDDNSWTAEMRIPWGTLGMPANVGPADIGINFRRREPLVGEYMFWSLQPPATSFLAINYFGHLTGLTNLRPTQRLFLQPYVAVSFDQNKNDLPSRLTDFTGGGGHARIYGGFYARYRPPGIPLQIDVTMNPDFSAVNPDNAVANLDRFELSFPEARPFFSEDLLRFQFGTPDAQLFYTRRVGLGTDLTGVTKVVPIIYGAKGVLRSQGTEVALMNVELSTPDPRISFADNITVVRLNHTFGHGIRVGNIFLGRQGDSSKYLATGVDGAYTLFDEHLVLSGFIARTATAGASAGIAAQGALRWSSEDYYGGVSYLDVSSTFDPQLGYLPVTEGRTTGARSSVFSAGYTPVVRNDLVQQVALEASLNRTRDQSNSPIYDRVELGATAYLLNNGYFQVNVLPSVEQVDSDFRIAAKRITVAAGHYDVLAAQVRASTAPRGTVVGSVSYTEGDLFAGYRRVPSAKIGLNVGRYSGSLLYQLFLIHYGTRDLTGHQVSARSTISYTALARSTLVVEANTLTLRSVVQLVNSYTFGALSTVALTMSETTGANLAEMGVPGAASWSANPNFTAVLSFAYGLTPF